MVLANAHGLIENVAFIAFGLVLFVGVFAGNSGDRR